MVSRHFLDVTSLPLFAGIHIKAPAERLNVIRSTHFKPDGSPLDSFKHAVDFLACERGIQMVPRKGSQLDVLSELPSALNDLGISVVGSMDVAIATKLTRILRNSSTNRELQQSIKAAYGYVSDLTDDPIASAISLLSDSTHRILETQSLIGVLFLDGLSDI